MIALEKVAEIREQLGQLSLSEDMRRGRFLVVSQVELEDFSLIDSLSLFTRRMLLKHTAYCTQPYY